MQKLLFWQYRIPICNANVGTVEAAAPYYEKTEIRTNITNRVGPMVFRHLPA